VAYTTEQLESKIEALEGALSRQSKTVQYADRAVTYKSFEEIMQMIAYWERKLRTSPRSKVFHVTADKGFDPPEIPLEADE
jgi:hypothetical protein